MKIIFVFATSILGATAVSVFLVSSSGLMNRLVDLISGEFCPASGCFALYGRATVITLLAAYAAGLLLAWKISRSVLGQKGNAVGMLLAAAIGVIPTLALLVAPVFAIAINGGPGGALLFLLLSLIFALSAALGFNRPR